MVWFEALLFSGLKGGKNGFSFPVSCVGFLPMLDPLSSLSPPESLGSGLNGG